MAVVNKQIKRILLILVISILILLALPFILITIEPVQNYLIKTITNEISSKIGTKVSIGDVDFKIFNSISIKEIYVEDTSKDTLIYAKELDARFSPLYLLRKKILIEAIRADNILIKININTEGIANISILDKLFSSKKGGNKSNFIYQVDAITLRNSSLSFIDQRYGQQREESEFNPANILLRNINGDFQIDKIYENYFNARIKRLSFAEKSGFVLDNLKTAFVIDDSVCLVKNTKISLPSSDILVDSLSVNYKTLMLGGASFAQTKLNVSGAEAKISPKDFASFNRQLALLDNNINIKLSLYGSIGDIMLNNFTLNYGNQIGFIGNANIVGLPEIDKLYLSSNILNLYASTYSVQDIISKLTNKPYLLPYEVQRINKISYRGKIAGYLTNLKLTGKLNAAIGSLVTDIDIITKNKFKDIQIDGNISSTGLDFKSIMRNDSGLNKIAFQAYTKIKIGENLPISAYIDAKIKTLVYKHYAYSNIDLNGKLEKDKFEGNAHVNDKNGKLQFHGLVDLSDTKNKIFYFNATIKKLNLYGLRLINDYPNLNLSCDINANFSGSSIDNINGKIDLDSILIKNSGIYKLNSFNITSKTQNDSLITVVESDIINGYISGKYSFAKIPADIVDMIKEAIPIIKNGENNLPDKYSFTQRNNLGFYFEIEQLQDLCKVLDIPWQTTKKSFLSGFYNGDVQMFNVDLELPQITNGASLFNSTRINCYKNESNIKLLASTSVQLKNDSLLLVVSSTFENDAADLLIAWKNFDVNQHFEGEIVTNTKFYKNQDNKLNLNINILPTQIIFKENILDIHRSSVFTDFEIFRINDFAVVGKNQNIKINGIASKSEDEHLNISIKRIDLDFISSFLPNNSALSFGGIITGDADVSATLSSYPIIKMDIKSDNLFFNDYSVGELSAKSDFDNATKSLRFSGTLKTDSTNSYTTIEGGLFLKQDSLFLSGNAQNLRIQLVKRFVKDIFSEVDGYGTGNVKVYANLKREKTTVEADVNIKQGHLKVHSLGSDFYFEDRILMTKDSIIFKNISIADKEGNRGSASGYVAHKMFLNVKYNIDFLFQNMQVFNQGRSTKDMPLYGLAYASGSCNINGTDNLSKISGNIITEPNTKIFILLNNNPTSTASNFVSFVQDTLKVNQKIINKAISANSNLILDFNIKATPDAFLQLFIDPTSGDMIKARGEGILRITYNSRTSDFGLYGNYTLTEGKYRFSFQQALEREFTIKEGSTLIWSGNPELAIINLKAFYPTKASIKGIFDKSVLSQSYTNSNVPVHCILNLTGTLNHPNISFDIELPSSDDNMRRALKNMITTDEMMNRQIVYLLAFDRFYNPNQQSLDAQTNSSSQTQNDVLSIVAATVGSQLNSLLSQISDKITIGVNLRFDQQPSGAKNNEYGVNINYSPNDRVLINSSLGYREEDVNSTAQKQQTSKNALSNAILDFEIEYKLNQSGRLVAKVYNRTNSVQDFKDAPYTQGIGIVYRESFNSLKALFSKKKKKNNKKKEKVKEPKKKKKNKK